MVLRYSAEMWNSKNLKSERLRRLAVNPQRYGLPGHEQNADSISVLEAAFIEHRLHLGLQFRRKIKGVHGVPVFALANDQRYRVGMDHFRLQPFGALGRGLTSRDDVVNAA